MIKQRILGLALSLALLGTLGLSMTARADSASQNITVTATVVDTLTLTLNTSAIDFGQSLNFLGQGAGAGITTCTNPAQTGIQGARYVSPDVIATVQSNRPYNVGRGAADGLSYATLQALGTRGWIGSGAFTGCGTSATNISTILANLPASQYLATNAPATMGKSYTEFYMLDVLTNTPGGTSNATITYAVSAS